jgi:nucleotide-binding universal stress UspA family protein
MSPGPRAPARHSSEPPIRRVVFATDLTHASDSALTLAAQIARVFDADVVLVHVLPDHEDPRASDTLGMAPGDVLERRAGEAQGRLRRLEAVLGRGHAHASVRCGSAATEILRLATDVSADAIVLGAREPAASGAECVEAVAERVLARARCPVLIALPARQPGVPAEASSPGLLIAVDRHRSPEATLELGRTLGRRLRREVHVHGGDSADIVPRALALGDDLILVGPRRRCRLRTALHLSAA